MNDPELVKLEEELYRSRWDDGLLDAFVGGSLVLIGVGWLCDLVALTALGPAVAAALWRPVRQRWTVPRVGDVRFGSERRRWESRWTAGMCAGGVVTLAIAVAFYLRRSSGVSSWDDVLRYAVAGLPCAILALMAVVAAGMLGLARFLGYALVLLAAGGAVVVLEAEPGWSMLGAGVVVLATSIVIAARFARRHPRVDLGASS